MDFNKLLARAKAMLLTPRTEWPVAATEPTTVGDLYRNYILPLAAIPVVFGFLKMSLIGVSMPFAGTVRTPVGAGITSMVLSYALSLLGVYVMALIIDALAPTFNAQKDRVQALKTIAYAYTAAWVAGAGQIVPGIGLLIMLAGGIYSIYLLYLGLPHTMKCPQDRAGGYTAVTIIIAIILWILTAAIVGAVAGVGSFMGGGSSIGASDDSALGRMEQWGKQVEEAGKQFEAAQESGDQEAQAEALKQMMGAALGGAGGPIEALAPERLKPFVPESLAGMARSDFSVERNDAMGLQVTAATATYSREDGRTLDLEITDAGSASGLLAFAGRAGMESESETASGYEKTYRKDGRLMHEAWDRDSSYGDYSVVLGERFTVKVSGAAASIDELKSALGAVDLDGLEALKDEGVKKQ